MICCNTIAPSVLIVHKKLKTITKKQKIAGFVTAPNPKKQAGARQMNFVEGLPLAWRFSNSDKAGKWAWSNLSYTPQYQDIMSRLAHFETLNYDELLKTGSHPIKIAKLIPDAQKRLRDIKCDDLDELFSLRVQGKCRVFCILDRNIMKILWWDPHHEVCPSLQKHT